MKRCYSCFKEFDDEYDICPHCGQVETSEPLEPIHLKPGTILADRYLLGVAVGSGGFGIIYKAWDLQLEVVVAVKEFYVSRLVTRAAGEKEVIVSKKAAAEYTYRKERFLAEARNMAKFSNHRSIVNVFEFFEENNTAYIVMELLDGVNLNEYIKANNGKVDPGFAVYIANEVGNALISLHENNIIHRDVAPDNVFICSDKELKIKLLDLGAAKLADSTDDVIDIVLKPGYSPTEQYDNTANIGPWTDIYALGATLYRMLTGAVPDESTNRKIEDTLAAPNEIDPSIETNLSNTIMKAMAIDRHMRFRTVAEFLKAVNGDKKIVTLEKEKKRRKRKRLIGVLIAACLTLAATAAVWQYYDTKKTEDNLDPAEITLWYSLADGSNETIAINSIVSDFESKHENVTIEATAIPEKEYEAKITQAAQSGTLPNVFESSGLSSQVLQQALDLDNVLASEQSATCLFLDQYDSYYSTKKQVPMGIEVPVAFVVTSGYTCIDYEDSYFSDINDFGGSANISFDSRCADMLNHNFDTGSMADRKLFFNNKENTSAVCLGSTMMINEVRRTLTNYEKTYVYYDAPEIYCSFIYEWSIGSGTEAQNAAAECLLSWMLGNAYQNKLMIGECNDGQIPVNEICFNSKIETKNLAAIGNIYSKFVFEN